MSCEQVIEEKPTALRTLMSYGRFTSVSLRQIYELVDLSTKTNLLSKLAFWLFTHFMTYYQEFLVIALVHLLAVASPGPDFAIVLKQSIQYGRKIALYTSVGIAVGILLHVTYSLAGIGLIIATDERLLTLLKYIAAMYFLYIAYHGLRAGPATQDKSLHREQNMPSNKRAFVTGFLVNGLNVKATLFFVSVFSVVISVDTPFSIKLGYGLYMAVATAVWFCSLSLLLNHGRIKAFLLEKGYWLERVMAIVLLLLAAELIFGDH